MNGSEIFFQTEEFRQTYENVAAPVLPQELSSYRFVSCVTDSDRKKTWLLEKRDGQKVLCKYASGEYVDMLRTESVFFTLGKFPFVPYVLDYFEDGESAYLIREYIEGLTMTELVEREGPLPLSRAVPLVEQVCGCLSRLHGASPPIIFRDLKPSNIVLHPSGDLFLIDVGTVRTYHTDDSPDTVFVGTVDTAAPEQFGARQTDERTDIYALGILFYYLLTGELKIQESRLKKLPSRAAYVIHRCTAFDPNDRYSNVTKVASALHPSPWIRIRVGVGAVVACAIITLGAFFFSTRSDAAEITFTSPLLEQAVREAVGKADGESVYESDLVQVTQLYICGDTVFHNESEHNQYMKDHSTYGENHGYGDIKDISLLQNMPNLHYLVLDYQQIYDLMPLQDLQLTTLSLCGNPVTDLSPLEGQNTLGKLYLSETPVSSLESLRECSALTVLDCSYTSVASLEPLSELGIYNLFLADAPIADFSPLTALPVQELYISHVPAANLASLNDLTSLKNLTLYSSGVTSLNELSGLTRLIHLDLTGNMLTDLEGLEQFIDLQSIIVFDNPITDLSPMADMGNLSSLGIATGTDVDFSFLNEMPWVERITIRSSQSDALYRAVPEPWFDLSVF